MYCSHCGKKVNDTMLFCPFCGNPIEIPEQDEPDGQAAPAVPAEPAVQAAPAGTEAEDAASDPARVVFEPLDLDAASGDGPISSEAPEAKPREAMNDAAAELLDWESSRKEFASDDAWSDRGARHAEPFAPLTFMEEEAGEDVDWRAEIARKKEQDAPQKKAPDLGGEAHDLPRLDGVAPKLEADIKGAKPVSESHEKPRKGKSASTLVPPKAMDPNDIFMDGSGKRDFDDFDDFDKPSGKDFAEGDYVFEDTDEGSFFMRHIRGIVGLALLVVLLLIFVVFSFFKPGQQMLAKFNLAWSTDAYSTIGYQRYQDHQYDEAGLYYERALQRDPDNYGYASSAAMAYIEAGNRDKAAEMLKQCARIEPKLLEPYIYLLNLYPDAADRPWDVTQLLQEGYKNTGDTRLNVTG